MNGAKEFPAMPESTRYFAYGSNLDTAQMAHRCPAARCLGLAVLEGYRFMIMSRGYATIVPQAGALVHGLLWSLTPEDVASLDRYESVDKDHYRKQAVTVDATGLGAMPVLTYIARDTVPGRPSAGYLERIVGAAEVHGLPGEYIAELRSWFSSAAEREVASC